MTYHGAVDADENQSLFPVVQYKGSGKLTQVDASTLLCEFGVAHLE
jgi:hypothetical protein